RPPPSTHPTELVSCTLLRLCCDLVRHVPGPSLHPPDTAMHRLLPLCVLFLGLAGLFQGCKFDEGRLSRCSSDAECSATERCNIELGVCEPIDVVIDIDVDQPDVVGPPRCGEVLLPCGDGQLCCTSASVGMGCADGGDDCACTATVFNNLNCGECGTVCNGDLQCVSGTCVCPAGTDQCDPGMCSDVINDRLNCGTCDNACADGQDCQSGRCFCGDRLCDAGTDCCDVGAGALTCIDTQSNPNHCGDCGIACGDGETCMDGRCVCATDMGELGAGEVCTADGLGEFCCTDGCVTAQNDPTCECGGPGLFCGAS